MRRHQLGERVSVDYTGKTILIIVKREMLKLRTTLRAVLFVLVSFASLQANALQVGDTAPAFKRPDIYDATRTLDFARSRGRVVYLDFWASWCGPCRSSLPALNRLYQQLKPEGFQIVAVNLDEDRAEALAFLQQNPVSYPVVTDQGPLAEQFGVLGMPSGFLIDRAGKIRHIHLGFRIGDEARLKRHILQLLQGEK